MGRQEVAEGQGVVLDAEPSHGGGQLGAELPQGGLGGGQAGFVEEPSGGGDDGGLALLEGAVVEVVEEEPDVGDG